MLYLEPITTWHGAMLCRATADTLSELPRRDAWFNGLGYALVDPYVRRELIKRGAVVVAHRMSPAYRPTMDEEAGVTRTVPIGFTAQPARPAAHTSVPCPIVWEVVYSTDTEDLNAE